VYNEPFGKSFDEVGPEDIRSLIDNEIQEGHVLEYKERLPEKGKQNALEFLADVSSFANAGGGYLIYGIAEKREQGHTTGCPVLAPLPVEDVDRSIRRLEDLMRNGIRPRIPQARMRHVAISDASCVIIIWIPKSFASPHMTSLGLSTRFYSRNSRGKYQLDIDEIRRAFASSMDLAERIKRFRDDRVASIMTGETPVRLLADPKLVVHLVPLSAFDPSVGTDITTAGVPLEELALKPTHDKQRYNLDGYLLSTDPDAPFTHYGYLQLFRSGTVELLHAPLPGSRDRRQAIRSPGFERLVAELVQENLGAQLRLGLGLPFAAMVTLLDASGYRLHTKDYQYEVSPQIDRDLLPLPEILIRELPFNPYREFKPTFDAFWQACGQARCPHYEEGGLFAQMVPADS